MRLLNEQKIWKYGRLGPVWPGSLAMVLVIRIRADFKSSPATYSERGLFPCVGGARHRPTWYHARCSAQLGLGGIACLLGGPSRHVGLSFSLLPSVGVHGSVVVLYFGVEFSAMVVFEDSYILIQCGLNCRRCHEQKTVA